MAAIPFLIIFPMAVSVLMFLIKNNKIRNIIAYAGTACIMAATFVLVGSWIYGGCAVQTIAYASEIPDKAILSGEVILMIVVTVLSFKYKKYWVSLLSIVPTCLMVWLELSGMELTAGSGQIYIDHLSILMCMIVGIIGSLIVVYAIGYMHGYAHHHTEFPDRRNYFFMVLFLFLGAMFGFVLSESLLWIDFFWELTSVCSFLLIGYTKTEEAINNCFRALWMNLTGGVFLAVGIVYFAVNTGNVSLHYLVNQGIIGAEYTQITVAFIAFAALTKAAQLPFSTWLIGAMVAPTPSSALLHSATMVKAGIYVLFRLAPAMSGNMTGIMIAFIGGFTFLDASIMAIAQSDGKKVLAFSTISNLGLMVACAGVGTAETIWAGTFLMIFHAISKSLLFQDVGATENSIHSRDIEAMHGLIYRLPKLATFMFIGIAGMFLAPFGMLISKWAVLRASVDERNILLAFFIIFGSATTSFYWTKWMGKLISRPHVSFEAVKDITKPNEMFSLTVHAALMIIVCALFPLISEIFVDPLVAEEYGVYTEVLPARVLLILVLIILLIFAVPFIAYLVSRNDRTDIKPAYINGINAGDDNQFTDSFGNNKRIWLSNYYFAHRIGQRALMKGSQVFTAAVLIVMLSMIAGGAL